MQRTFTWVVDNMRYVNPPAKYDALYSFNTGKGNCQNYSHLAAAILNAFEFDHDHLYKFTFENRFGLSVDVNHPYVEEPPFADEILIGDLPLEPGNTMIFLYDFGDNWEFGVHLEQIDPPDRRRRKPVVLASRGKAPKQYPDWDG